MKWSYSRKPLSWPKLIGSLIFVGALLMVFKSGADLFTSWDNIKSIDNCLGAAQADPSFSSTCQTQAYYAGMGLIRAEQKQLTNRQAWGAIFDPMGLFFVWLAVLVWGWTAYKAGWIPRMVFSLLNEATQAMDPKKRK